jgi:hypothetical protein
LTQALADPIQRASSKENRMERATRSDDVHTNQHVETVQLPQRDGEIPKGHIVWQPHAHQKGVSGGLDPDQDP